MPINLAGSAVLSIQAQAEVHKLYAETDARGRRVHSYRTLGRMFAVSETTIMRCIQRTGPYIGAIRAVVTDERMRVDAAASLAKLQQQLSEPMAPEPPDESAELSPELRAKADAIAAEVSGGNSGPKVRSNS